MQKHEICKPLAKAEVLSFTKQPKLMGGINYLTKLKPGHFAQA